MSKIEIKCIDGFTKTIINSNITIKDLDDIISNSVTGFIRITLKKGEDMIIAIDKIIDITLYP